MQRKGQLSRTGVSDLPRQTYRRLRPVITEQYKRVLMSRILDRTDLINDPPPSIETFQFGEDEYYDFDKPCHVGELPNVIETKLHGYRIWAPYVIEATDATVVGPSGIAFVDGQIILDSVRGSYLRLVDASIQSILNGQLPWSLPIQASNKHYDRPVFSLVGPWTTEYYHWFTDYLVRIFALEAYKKQTGREPDILIPSDCSEWMLESLSLAGFDKNKFIEWDAKRAEFSRLVIGSVRFKTPNQSDGHIHSPRTLAKLGDRIRNNVSTDGSDPKRLYVSRADATNRQVRNEKELVSMLENYGFKQIVPGELSFPEQVNQFANAEIIVGPHGGGLTNTIFAEDTFLIELFGSYQNPCYFGIARGMEHGYASVSCQPRGDDMEVDVSELSALLETVEGRI